jgi:hypothetical protein
VRSRRRFEAYLHKLVGNCASLPPHAAGALCAFLGAVPPRPSRADAPAVSPPPRALAGPVPAATVGGGASAEPPAGDADARARTASCEDGCAQIPAERSAVQRALTVVQCPPGAVVDSVRGCACVFVCVCRSARARVRVRARACVSRMGFA